MSEDTETGAGLREQVRSRYAGAALAVLGQADGGDGAAAMPADAALRPAR